ncbi:MAG: lactonase family protein [Anaerotruncus sp.]|nr:lactonase family protein [Anaerotruncus sp.]
MKHKNYTVFVGTYSETIKLGTGEIVYAKGEGIYTLQMDAQTGALTLLKKALGEPNPSYVALHKNKKVLYSTNELKTYKGLVSGAVSAFSFERESGKLTLLNRWATGGTDAVHLALDKDCTHAFVANFMSGSVCVLPILEDGSLERPSCFLQHKGSGPNPIRQTGPHAHQFQFDRLQRRAFVPDLGCDKTFIYEIDYENGHLNAAKQPYVETEKGQGPRHCVFHPSGQFFYVVNEMGSSIDVYSYEEEQGAANRIQHITTLPEDFIGHSTCAAIKFHPNGKFLYASNRGHNSLATYQVGELDGLLTPIAYQPTGGETPRDFDLDPVGKFLIAANQDSNNLVVFSVEESSGHLTEVSRLEDIFTATCVAIYDLDA